MLDSVPNAQVGEEVHDWELFQQIMDYDLDVVTETFARRNPEFANEAKVLETECKRFLYIAAIMPNLEHAPTKPIDEYWHSFILFTREYTDFCQQMAGRYIHHKPLGADDHQAVFDRTYETAVMLFSATFPNQALWQLPAPATSCCSAVDVDQMAA